MHLGLILDMARSGMGDRTAVCGSDRRLTYEELAERASAAAASFTAAGARSVVYLGTNEVAFPVALFGAVEAGLPFVPLNYRLGAEQLQAQMASQAGAYLIHGAGMPVLDGFAETVEQAKLVDAVGVDASAGPADPGGVGDPEAPALLLYTSGTTSAPKAAVLRHRHLMAYVLGTVEFAGAEADEATLISVPPYHIAGVANLVSNLYAGRRIVYLERFDPEVWLSTLREEHITHAMVIPTMLARVVEHLGDRASADVPSLRSLSYGGSRMPTPVLRRALELFPTTDFVNAYGLTETSSTIALLGPEDHRQALQSTDPAVQRRIESVGQLLPGIEVVVRDDQGQPSPPGEPGLIFLRGEQISGEYEGASATDGEGWFATRDRGWVDEEGYLFIEGRADDTIIRGGENIAPAEIEDVLLAHPHLIDAVVVGLPDEEWGQRLVAVVVAREGAPDLAADPVREWVRERLRSSKTPEVVEFWPELPRTDTGKLLRRQVVARLSE